MTVSRYRRLAAIIAVLFLVVGLSSSIRPSFGDAQSASARGEIQGVHVPGAPGVSESVAEVMARQAALGPQDGRTPRLKKEWESPRRNLPKDPAAIEGTQWPPAKLGQAKEAISPFAPQTLGTQFDGATGPTETGAFPPDTMGAVGPTQFVVFLNGRIRTFNKTTGVADSVINADPDAFFASVMTPPLAGEVVFTSDPNVRYDRLSARWFMTIIDVVLNASSGATTRGNRLLIAVSDAASAGVISAGTVWTFYFVQVGATIFLDYPSLGIDNDALYVGGDMFTLGVSGSFSRTDGYVIRKSEALTGAPLNVTLFMGLVATPTGAGPFAPRGVDNYSSNVVGADHEGYFIGVDNATFNNLVLRRVTNPQNAVPTISGNILIGTTLTTRFPVLVPHLGNTGGTGGRLDSLDDRLYAAHIRNGRLWTAHSIGVNNTGVAGATNNRNAARWYELQNVLSPGVPSVLQVGTLFEPGSANDANQRNYWMPSIMVSGQGHAAIAFSGAGTNERINAWTTGRLVGDTLGVMPTPVAYTASATAYNPPGDPGGPSRRWGDYSYVSLDPKDDMTMWAIQEYCNGTNTYGVRAVKLIAPPPPPTNSANPAAIQLNNPSTTIIVTGSAPAGQGFYDPGTNHPAPALPFTHIGASGAGIIVNNITYNTPTQVTLNVSTVGATPGTKTVTITNPDGQTTTVQILVGPTAAKMEAATATWSGDGSGALVEWRTGYEVDNLGFNVYREESGKKTLVNASLVAGSALRAGGASPAGESYAWWDGTRPGKGQTQYWIEAVDLNGRSTWSGPITPVAAAVGKNVSKENKATLLSELGQGKPGITKPVERAATLPQSAKSGAALATNLPEAQAVKLGVREEGWYRVSQADLIAAGLNGQIDPRLLQMYVDGQQVAIRVAGEEDGRLDPQDAVEFYGIGVNAQSTDTHVYWLVAGSVAGERVPPASGSNPRPVTGGSFSYTVERKDRTMYFPAALNGDTENFYGALVPPTGVDQALNVSHLAASSAQATLEVALQGATELPHRVSVILNGTALGEVAFDGRAVGTVSFSVPGNLLVEGENLVKLVAQQGQNDFSLVDYIRLTYAHSFTADNNALRLTTDGQSRVTVTGFTQPDVRLLDVTDAGQVRELANTVLKTQEGYEITAAMESAGARTLMVFAGGQVKSVASITANQPSDWRGSGHSADLVIITQRDLSNSVEPLKQLRESQGLRVAVVDVEDVYDEFSYGVKSPYAIRAFLEFAKNSWAGAPKYVLMVGDASYDPKNYLGLGGADLVSTKLIDTYAVETASDDWFADFAGTGLAQMAIGRLPVNSIEEADQMVNKIVGYDASSPEGVLLVSDTDPGGYFDRTSSQLGKSVPDDVRVTEIHRSDGDPGVVKARILESINSGQRIVNYIGHGSVDHWAGELLTGVDATNLTNQDRLSAFVDMTCLNGYFQAPGLDSLSESLLKARGGAVAVWSSSGMTVPTDQATMNQELYRLLLRDGSLTLGEATQQAKAAVADRDVRATWILFGDPSGRLR